MVPDWPLDVRPGGVISDYKGACAHSALKTGRKLGCPGAAAGCQPTKRHDRLYLWFQTGLGPDSFSRISCNGPFGQILHKESGLKLLWNLRYADY